ncbi:MAG TPA: M23 family metallopeptidase [Flavisolibacter sp.]|nr:M23 family metallopeptidase [Flavisolibacter sp.]
MKKFSVLPVLLAVALVSFSFIKNPARRVPSKSLSRSLAFPVAGRRSTIGGFWGDNRDGGRRLHKGIDIYARKGTPVVAIADGRIVTRDNTPIGGKTLWLKSSQHPWTAYYAHLDRQLVKEGQYVRKGQVIGTVGNTGNARSRPPHLHFGISPGGGWVNPMPYVKYSPKVTAPVLTNRKMATIARNARTKHRRLHR